MTIQKHVSTDLTKRRDRRGTIIYMGNIDFSGNSAAFHRVFNNGKIFRDLGYRVVFFGTAKGERFEGVRRSAQDPGVYEEAYPSATLSWIKHTVSAENIRLLASKFDDLELIITYNIPFATFNAIRKAFRHSAVKLAYDCTEWSNYTDGSVWKRLYKKVDVFELIRFLPKKCHNMIVVSSLTEDRYKACNTLRLPPLVDTTEWKWRQAERNRSDTYTFCYSAATFENKDSPDILLRAFGALKTPDVRLILIGIERDEAVRSYPHLAELLSTDDRISFTGRLSHEATIQRLLTSDCFVFFREKNRRNNAGFPTKFVEAYTCSTLILTNDTGDLGDYADGQSVIVADEVSVDGIAELLQTVSSKRERSAKGVNTTFDYHQYIDRTEKWISKLY